MYISRHGLLSHILYIVCIRVFCFFFFFFQAEDGIRDLVRSRGLGDVYKRQDWRGPRDHGGHRCHNHPHAVGARHDDGYGQMELVLSLIHI